MGIRFPKIGFTSSERTEICRLAGRDGEEVAISILCENRQELSRAKTYTSKEPETIRWLAKHTRLGEILWDIGSCVGQYALYGAKLGLKVWAFEPHLSNAAKLLRNVQINKLTHAVKVVPICLSDGERFGGFFVSSFEPGTSIHTFRNGQSGGMAPVAFPNHTVLTQFSNLVFATTGDKLVNQWGFPPPHHIKIDTDGNEREILDGMKDMLEDSLLRSVLVEVHDDGLERTRSFMRLYGFEEDADYSDTSRAREKRRAALEGGRWGGCGNMVFVRR